MNRIRITIVVAVVALGGSCSGRAPAVFANDDGHITPPPPPPPAGPPRALLAAKRPLFGTMPVENRFQDPLMTMSGTGWFGYANDFQSYANLFHRVGATPTQTPFLEVPTAGNPSGATLIGQLKTAKKPLHVEVWLGRAADATGGAAYAQLIGLFADGENAVPLVATAEAPVTLDGRTWQRFAADVAEGPIGWAYLIAGDTSSPAQTLFVGGPAAVDVQALPNAAFVSSPKRALGERERRAVDAVRARTRTLVGAHDPGPRALPGLPPPTPSAR